MSLIGGNWSCWGYFVSWGKFTGDRDYLVEVGFGCRSGVRFFVGLLLVVLCVFVLRGRRGSFWFTFVRVGCSYS